MLQISQLVIYPIKSLGGIALTSAKVTDRGLQYDRRWMLIDEANRFLSQRENPQLALFIPEVLADGLRVTHRPDASFIHIPYRLLTPEMLEVTIWDDTCLAQRVSDDADQWFSQKLGIKCRLVYMPDETHRQTDLRYTQEGNITSFADAYPALLIGQASLDDLNERMAHELPMDRFRPNIVFTGGEAYSEDVINEAIVNGIHLFGVKLCARCVLTTVDQVTAIKGKEPLKTLARYRRKENKILFGQNLVFKGQGELNVGDELKVLSVHTADRFIVPKLDEKKLKLRRLG
ncbi:MOSC domain-containing protein [Inquilinus sp. KBS0705]|nr:MOSC domain-containing protein [Inquilinus sp. KBS0705]